MVIRVNQIYCLVIENLIFVYFSKYMYKRVDQKHYDIQISAGEMCMLFLYKASRLHDTNILKLVYRLETAK